MMQRSAIISDCGLYRLGYAFLFTATGDGLEVDVGLPG